MIEKIRTSKFSKVVACYLAIMMFLQVTQPMTLYALTEGPSQPEFNSFTPISTSDMVDLASGDFNYNIPIMDVGGYPINLAYNSGTTMDQEASWVGLGWNLNVGQINRNIRGLPDDFDGDKMIYENNMKDNITIGANFNGFASGFGIGEEGSKKLGLSLNSGFGIKYNNYDGFGFSLSAGLSYDISDNVSVGMEMQSSATEGVTASPSISFKGKNDDLTKSNYSMGGSVGLSTNSRKGVENVTMSAYRKKQAFKEDAEKKMVSNGYSKSSIGSSISFVDASFTPTKRVGMTSSNYVFNLNLEAEMWGFEPGTKFTGYRTKQGIASSEKYKQEKAFGYENTHKAGNSDILDFNRELDRTVTQSTSVLPITNYTYDLYSIQGQDISGMFRPYRSQVGFVYDNYTSDDSNGGDLGIELGAGGGVHWGFDGEVSWTKSHSGLWNSSNDALNRFKPIPQNNPSSEAVYFKNIGGSHVDKDSDIFYNQVNNYKPVQFGIHGSWFNRDLKSKYNNVEFNGKINRNNRVNRNQYIQKLSKAEAVKYGFNTITSPYAQKHHTAEIRIIKEGGNIYVFGKSLYNVVKKEVTFDAGDNLPNNKTNLVNYTPGSDNSPNNKQSGDQYFNRVTTPAYAHTYLLSAVLSSDYQDLTGNGPSDDDLGSYTKFYYENKTSQNNLYKWRVPFQKNKANYEEGLKSSSKDNKANYQYGEKELSYIKKIETKTHIAIFDLSERRDSKGVLDENGGLNGNCKMYKIDKIRLYSKPEYAQFGDEAKPIKTAHFEYDYTLCPNVDNNDGAQIIENGVNTNAAKGKLTLKKVYFTYANSNMGKYTPYVFNYFDGELNPSYDMKAYDIWGGYKPNPMTASNGTISNPTPSNAEFPYTAQNQDSANNYTKCWHLQSIELPSGGKINIELEADDYRYVQNKEVMQMFDVLGAGQFEASNPNTNITNNLTNSNCIYIKVNETYDNHNDEHKKIFIEKYIRKLINQPVFFRFLLNMNGVNPQTYDYVTGYLELTGDFKFFGNNIVGLRVKMVGTDREADLSTNPISKAGWQFGRTYLNRVAYGWDGEEETDDLKGVVMSIIGAFGSIMEMFSSPNGTLKRKGVADKFIAGKSWIRLMQPDEKKFGGGNRVSRIELSDNWEIMANNGNKGMSYGQVYTYQTKDGKSSGVATYEPIGSKENPWVYPYNTENNRGALLGSPEKNFVDSPTGECFFPSPNVTYSRVEVTNLPRSNKTKQVKKHATGKVVTEFYTSYDYPTLFEKTNIKKEFDKTPPVPSLLNFYLLQKTHLTMTQGFTVHTNDMNGKMKSQRVYAEDQDEFISGVDYNYDNLTQTGIGGKLDNNIITIDRNGKIAKHIVGVDYDVINDFRENESTTETVGVKFNTAGIPLALIFVVIPTPLPSYSEHQNLLRTASTTKVVHSCGILRETVAYDVGSKVSTKNLAWDAETGDVLITETVNEYNDKYYTTNFPAYWAYEGMAQSSKNLDSSWEFEVSNNDQYKIKNFSTVNTNYLTNGDELWLVPPQGLLNSNHEPLLPMKGWVVNLQASKFNLIDKRGMKINSEMLPRGTFKIIKSGYKNLQMSSMASITSMKNPLFVNDRINNTLNDTLSHTLFETAGDKKPKIINASAIEYKEIWPAQCECNLPKMKFSEGKLVFEYNAVVNSNDDPDDVLERAYNPYLYNILGNWRANKSYAYLTGRNNINNVPRISGFYEKFNPFYILTDNKWVKVSGDNYQKWTSASQVTKANPHGQEVENKDALNRYSSAIYGYNYKFPIAVGSNAKYRELAFDGFEDYFSSICGNNAHFNFQRIISDSISISDKKAHTGKKSLRIEPKGNVNNPQKRNSATIKIRINPCGENGNIEEAEKMVASKKVKNK